MNEDGTAAWQDETRLAELVVDARSLGIELDLEPPEWHLARLTPRPAPGFEGNDGRARGGEPTPSAGV